MVTETVKHEIKKWEGRFPGPFLQPVISSVVKGISGRGVKIAGRWYMDKNF